ncbi:hypothetical protein ACA910_003012 [Epithemia clementina (nom. ined.)]
MGNKPFKIAVRLDQDACEAGQVITGKVYLSIGRGFDVTTLKGIHILLNGVERTDVAAEPGTFEYEKRRRSGRPVLETSTHTIVRADYPLVDLSGISRGQYEYPFQLPLRDDLPASLRCTLGDKDRSFCEVKYTLTAYVACTGVRNPSTDSLLSHELSLKMRGKPSNPSEGPKPIRTDTAIFPIATCWFWSQGYIALGWSSSCSVASVGDNVHVRVWGENRSRLEVEYISVKWMETVLWHNEQESGSGSRKKSNRLLAEQRESTSLHHPLWMATRNPPLSSHEALLQRDDHPALVFTLKIPSHARETFQGSLVEVRHSLVVCVITSGGYTSSTPESAFPVRIRPRRRTAAIAAVASAEPVAQDVPAVTPSAPSELYDTDQPIVESQALPADWNPVEAEVVSLPLATAVVLTESVDMTPPRTPIPSSNYNYYNNDPREALAVLPPPQDSFAAVNAKISEATSTFALGRTDDINVEEQLDLLAKLVAECPENLSVVLEDPIWASRVQNLSPREFCKFVQACSSGESFSMQEATVARMVAISMGPFFQTKHLLACLWILSGESSRTALLRDVSPLAADIASKRHMIEEELNSQELAVFRSAVNILALHPNLCMRPLVCFQIAGM